jgi:hypothetical protein
VLHPNEAEAFLRARALLQPTVSAMIEGRIGLAQKCLGRLGKRPADVDFPGSFRGHRHCPDEAKQNCGKSESHGLQVYPNFGQHGNGAILRFGRSP